ncbi:MAG: protein translocase subunit SecF, partial [Actinomycetota bacterium]|nr:protein translocase subunit SecF [Actinomycetota bacterium]
MPEAGDGTGEAEKRVEEADLEVPAPLDGSPGGTETAGEGDLTGGEAVRHGRRPAGAGARRGERPATPAPAGEPTGARPVRSGFFSRLYHGETNLEFVGRRRIWFAISALVILAGIVSLATRGLNLDIQFSGGTSWTVQWPGANVTQARDALAGFNLSGSTITVLGQAGGSSRSLQVEAKIPKGQTPAQTQAQLVKVEDTIARIAHVSPSEVSITSVGPSWGGEVTKKAIEALIVFFVLVALYISVFFEWRMALSAIVAVLHDILVVVGIYSLTGFDVTPDTVVAILTILGYSLYDTIVVFDRIRDNLKGVGAVGRLTISDVVNLSMNQTLARSINTSLVAILPIFAVLVLGAQILGATTLQYFGWALLIGLASGAYSSIFIASPIVAVLKEREPRWARIRERTAAARGGELLVLSPAAVAAGLLGGEGPGGDRRSRASRTAR